MMVVTLGQQFNIESFGTVFKGQTKPSVFFGGQMFCVDSR